MFYGYPFTYRIIDERPQCQDVHCDRAGDTICILDEDDRFYLCTIHAVESGFCYCCGTFIMGSTLSEVCDNCKDEIRDNFGDDVDEDVDEDEYYDDESY